MLQKSALFLILLFISAVTIKAQAKPKPSPTPETTSFYYLSAQELARFESDLKSDPKNAETRKKLINYYDENESEINNKAVQRHRLALIENNPEDATWLYLGTWLEDEFVKPDYTALKNGWLKKISLNKNNKEARFNAAGFFSNNPEIAEKILKDGQALDPKNFEYSAKLIEFYENSTPSLYGESEETRANKSAAAARKIVNEAQNAIEFLRKAETSEEVENNISEMLAVSARYSLETGDLVLAKKSADELLLKSGDPKSVDEGATVPNVENFQIANSVLGRIALRSGNVEKAREYLMNSLLFIDYEGNINPKFDGQFVEEMLVRNGSKNVIEYLELFTRAKNLDDSDKGIIKEMLSTIRRGKFPDISSYLSIY